MLKNLVIPYKTDNQAHPQMDGTIIFFEIIFRLGAGCTHLQFLLLNQFSRFHLVDSYSKSFTYILNFSYALFKILIIVGFR